jgi:hypothetical protein
MPYRGGKATALIPLVIFPLVINDLLGMGLPAGLSLCAEGSEFEAAIPVGIGAYPTLRQSALNGGAMSCSMPQVETRSNIWH